MRNLIIKLATLALVSLLTIGGAVPQETGEPSDTVITTDDCTTAWAQAVASSSRTTTVLAAEPAPGSSIVNNCAVKADCATIPGGEHDNFSDYHGGP